MNILKRVFNKINEYQENNMTLNGYTKTNDGIWIKGYQPTKNKTRPEIQPPQNP